MNRREEQVSLNIFDLIDSICREFRAEWKEGNRPSLDDWFGKVPVKAQPQLFRNLLEVDVRYRSRIGEKPTSPNTSNVFRSFQNRFDRNLTNRRSVHS